MRVTDGLLLDLNDPKAPKFWVVEVELSSHDPYRSTEPQIRGFLRALRTEETLYEELQRHPEWAALAQKALGGELHYALTKLLREGAGVVIVIDRVTPQLEELREEFTERDVEIRLLEFKNYKHGQEQIHSFTPLTSEAVGKETPEASPSWEARLRWANPEARSLVEELTRRVEGEFPDIAHRSRGRWYYFYKANRPFCVLILQKRAVHLRLITDPASFKDPRKATKKYRGWFWPRAKGRERGLTITSKTEFEYALALAKQAYHWVGAPPSTNPQ